MMMIIMMIMMRMMRMMMIIMMMAHGGDLIVPRSGLLTVMTRSWPLYLGWGLATASAAPETERGCSRSLRGH